MQGDVLNQDRSYPCNIGQDRFGKEESTFINIWKEKVTYVDSKEQARCDIFGSVKQRQGTIFIYILASSTYGEDLSTWKDFKAATRFYVIEVHGLGSSFNIVQSVS